MVSTPYFALEMNVLRVFCLMNQVVAGILASVDGDKLVTGKSWRCTTTQQVDGWASTLFDDNSWPDAVISGTNTASDIHGNLPQVDSSASWIWTSNNKGDKIDGTVYCRGYLGQYPVLVISVYARVY
jgi:hypothetical protein